MMRGFDGRFSSESLHWCYDIAMPVFINHGLIDCLVYHCSTDRSFGLLVESCAKAINYNILPGNRD